MLLTTKIENTMYQIDKLKIPDFEAWNKLLEAADLPIVDTTDQTEHFFKTTYNYGVIIGAIGLEIYGAYGLLRSLVVDEAYRSKGIAKLLVENVVKHSKTLHLNRIILLTTTADKYFERQHFNRIQRHEVPEEIKQSKEFSSLCPVSAIVMQKIL